MAITNRDHRLPSPDKARIRLLVEALRSGKYRQTTHKLARYDRKGRKKKYCCLGIACEVAYANGVPLKRVSTDSAVVYYDADNHGNTYTLPKAVRDWYGFEFFDPDLIDESGERDSASGLNDEKRYNFKRIADAFERTYLSSTESQ